MARKSQASLEFLMTYAWIFVSITVVIVALYSFGFLDLGYYAPQKCAFPLQFKCLDFSLMPNEIRLKLVNNLGENIEVTSLQITNDANPPISCTPTPNPTPAAPYSWADSQEIEVIFSSCTGGAYIPDERVELKVSMQYYAVNTPSRPIHTINGKINGAVTSG